MRDRRRCCCGCRTRPRRSACAARCCCWSLLVVLAEHFGLETILGAFVAGAIVELRRPRRDPTHPLFHVKLEAIGYGFLVPIFFVTSGHALRPRTRCSTTRRRCPGPDVPRSRCSSCAASPRSCTARSSATAARSRPGCCRRRRCRSSSRRPRSASSIDAVDAATAAAFVARRPPLRPGLPGRSRSACSGRPIPRRCPRWPTRPPTRPYGTPKPITKR